jgi:hypothetical protein
MFSFTPEIRQKPSLTCCRSRPGYRQATKFQAAEFVGSQSRLNHSAWLQVVEWENVMSFPRRAAELIDC